MADVGGDVVVTQAGLQFLPASPWRFTGSGGPGGQHANTSNTKVRPPWNIETSEVLTDFQRARLVAEPGPVARIVAAEERS